MNKKILMAKFTLNIVLPNMLISTDFVDYVIYFLS